MPPQPGVFALPYTTTHKGRAPNGLSENADLNPPMYASSLGAGPSRAHGTPMMEDPKSRKRKDLSGKTGRELGERREDLHLNSARHYAETITELSTLAFQLSTRPETVPAYQLRLLPLTTERSALLAALVVQERYSLECVQLAYREEQERVEDEWKKGREKIRERLLEGIEERKKRAREEKDGEGPGGDASLDTQSRPHITRKLRNKLGGGTSPPPTPGTPGVGGIASMSSGPITSGPFLNPHSLSVDELPSPFPLPLTSTHASSTSGAGAGNGRRRAKNNLRDTQALGAALGKTGQGPLEMIRNEEIEPDMNIIKRSKRRRVAAANLAKV